MQLLVLAQSISAVVYLIVCVDWLENPHLNPVVYGGCEDVLVLHGDLALLVQQHLLLSHKVIKVQGLDILSKS